MPVIHIDDVADPRLDHYRSLRDRVLRKDGGRFIAESHKVVHRMLGLGWPVESVLATPTRLAELQPKVPPTVPTYVIPNDMMTALAGFAIHTGVLAIGTRKPNPSLAELVTGGGGEPMTFLVCSQLKETANLGAIVRIGAGLGATGLIVGPECCDPFYRRAIRVSMGSVFTLPVRRADDLATDLRELARQHGVSSYAAVLSDDATPLHAVRRARHAAIVLGHEVDGLPDDILAACSQRLTITMAHQTDSLNVAMSAAVMLYGMNAASAAN